MNTSVNRFVAGVAGAAIFACSSIAHAQCRPAWSELGQGLGFAEVLAMAEFDPDGPGPAATELIVGGDFTLAGGAPASFIARWNGSTWSPLGAGLNGSVTSMTVFDDGQGAGPALYVAGRFTQAGGQATGAIARWDGAAWSAVGGGLAGTPFELLAAATLPGGPALLVGGFFLQAAGTSSSSLLRWDGAAWADYAPGGNFRQINALLEDAGQLYAGGFANDASAASGLARWDGAAWSPLGSGISGAARVVWDLARFDDGSGPGIFAGGDFTTAGGLPSRNIARWDGSSWSALGAGVDVPPGLNGFTPFVNSMLAFDPDGAGPLPQRLHIAGQFWLADGLPATHLASWRGGWSVPNTGLQRRMPVLASFDADGPGGPQPAQLIAGGRGSAASGVQVNHIAALTPGGWQPLGDGVRGGVSGDVSFLSRFDPDGPGPGRELLVACGAAISLVDGRPGFNLAFWDGAAWSTPPETPVLVNSDPVVLDPDGAGPSTNVMYLLGSGIRPDGTAMGPILAFDGEQWIDAPPWTAPEAPSSLVVLDDGGGPALYVLTLVGGGLFRYDGSAWVGPAGQVPADVTVNRFAAIEDGPMPGLWIVGRTGPISNRVAYAAHWEGGQWVQKTSGLPAISTGMLFDIGVIDLGSGPELFVSGSGPVAPARRGLWRWSEGAWVQVPSTLTQQTGPTAAIRHIKGWSPDGGAAEKLIACGFLYGIEGLPIRNPAIWDGASWMGTTPDLGTAFSIGDLETYDEDGPGPRPPALFFGRFGSLLTPGQVIARLACPPCLADLNGDGLVDFADYLEFLNLYDTEDPRVDFNGDGLVDFADYLEFLNLYDTGC